MKNVKQFQLVSILSGFLMLACVLVLGGYAAMSKQPKKTFKAANATNLNQKVITPDSTKRVN